MIQVSIIIPTYKPGDYIFDCLSSIQSQTFPKYNYEVIIVLNGCCEPYKTRLEEFIQKKMSSFNVVFIHNEEGGVSNARNIALDCMRGNYVTFIDDDDLISPDYLKLLYEKVSTDTVALCYPSAFVDGEGPMRNYRITREYRRRSVKGKQAFYKAKKFFSLPSMKLISRDVVQDRRFDPHFSNGEDSIFNFLISDRLKFVDFTSEQAVYYRRIRAGSATTVKRSLLKRFANSLNMIRAYSNILIKNPCKYNWWFYITRVIGALRSII